MVQYSHNEIARLKKQLELDAQEIKKDPQFAERADWIDPQKWSLYMGKTGRALYGSFSDRELLDILKREYDALGRVPSQRDVFCVYRDFIRRRFGNWVKALRAAGLNPPKAHTLPKDENNANLLQR